MNKLIQITGIIGYVFMTMHYYYENKTGDLMLISAGYSLLTLHYLNEYLEGCKSENDEHVEDVHDESTLSKKEFIKKFIKNQLSQRKSSYFIPETGMMNLNMNKITKGGFLLLLAHNLMKMYKTKQMDPSYLVGSISIIAYLLQYSKIAYGLFTLYYFKYVAQHAHDQNSLIGGYAIATMYLYKLITH